MPQHNVTALQPSRSEAAGFCGELEKMFHSIRERAYELFRGRGSTAGDDVADWLAAERDLFAVPASELTETDSAFTLRVAAPGYEPSQIQVAVEANAVTVTGKAEREWETKDARTVLSEFSCKELFRHFKLPAAIDPDQTRAHLDGGVLAVAMPKAAAAGADQPAAMKAAA